MSEKQLNPTLCWRCKKAVGKCPWSACEKGTGRLLFQPVPGWVADETVLLMYDPKVGRSYPERSYLVRECPLFEEDDRPEPTSHEVREEYADQAELVDKALVKYLGNRVDEIGFKHLDNYAYFDMRSKGLVPVYLLTNPKIDNRVVYAAKTMEEMARTAGTTSGNIQRVWSRKPKMSKYHIAWVLPEEIKNNKEEK